MVIRHSEVRRKILPSVAIAQPQLGNGTTHSMSCAVQRILTEGCFQQDPSADLRVTAVRRGRPRSVYPLKRVQRSRLGDGARGLADFLAGRKEGVDDVGIPLLA